MTKRQGILSLAVLASFVGLAFVAQEAAPTGTKMVSAAQEFLTQLTPEQKTKATYPFDNAERTNWHFVPLQDRDRKSTRKGLALEEMNPTQYQAAMKLLRSGTSDDGYKRATAVMSLEGMLNELEKGSGGLVRNPGWYFFTIFGTPAATGRWGWRVEGHHLSLNFVVDNGKVTAATPTFVGANPAIVQVGDKKGQKLLTEVDELAWALFKALNPDQQKIALQSKQFPEVKAQNKKPEVGEPVGLAAGKFDDAQRVLLTRLMETYVKTLPPDVAAAEMQAVQKAGLDKVFFGYAGTGEPGKPRTFRLQGPTFVAEFLNVQADSSNTPANHIHTAWRSLPADFGLGS